MSRPPSSCYRRHAPALLHQGSHNPRHNVRSTQRPPPAAQEQVGVRQRPECPPWEAHSQTQAPPSRTVPRSTVPCGAARPARPCRCREDKPRAAPAPPGQGASEGRVCRPDFCPNTVRGPGSGTAGEAGAAVGVREGGRQGYFLGRDTENFLEKCYGLWAHQATPCRAHRASSIHTHLLQGAQECKLLKRSNHVLPAFRALPATVPGTG